MADLSHPLLMATVFGGVVLALRRIAPRGSLLRMWCRLWLYTWRERARKARRRWQQRLVGRPTLPEAPRPAWPPMHGRHARDGVWVGNVFRPYVFMRGRPPR